MRFHPTEKPLKLIETLLKRKSNENDIILDCFSGSAITAIACHNLKRKFICIEKDKSFYNQSIERFNNITAQQSLFN